MGTMATIKIPVEDGTSLPAYLARPATDPAPVGVIVAHELFGVSPDIRGVADDLARAGFLTIAPEFYHRDAAPGRWLELDDAGRQEGFGYLHRLGRDQALADVAAALQWLGRTRVLLAGHPAIQPTGQGGLLAQDTGPAHVLACPRMLSGLLTGPAVSGRRFPMPDQRSRCRHPVGRQAPCTAGRPETIPAQAPSSWPRTPHQ